MEKRSEYAFSLDFKVRDCECDMQGIVNNSVYQNYLEHARHEFLLSRGISFKTLVEEQIHLVVMRAEIDYKKPLCSGDHFWVGISGEKQGRLKLLCNQDIYCGNQQQPSIRAKFTIACLNQQGRPFWLEELNKLLVN